MTYEKIMQKLSGEEICAFDFDSRGKRGVLGSTRGRIVFIEPENDLPPIVEEIVVPDIKSDQLLA